MTSEAKKEITDKVMEIVQSAFLTGESQRVLSLPTYLKGARKKIRRVMNVNTRRE